jgi:hypothetical protein
MKVPSGKHISFALAAGVGCAFFSAGLVTAIAKHDIGSSDAAGWVQAVGATVGLAIAIWIPYKQTVNAAREAEKHRRDSERRVCLAFRDELAILASRFSNRNITEVLRGAPDEIYAIEIPIPHSRFPIFAAFVSRLTEIEDEQIRCLIIEAYDSAHGLIDLAAQNNRHLLELYDLRAAQTDRESRARESSIELKQLLLTQLRLNMKATAIQTIAHVNAVRPMLDAAIARLAES